MANEFVARNGLISQNNSTVTGSLTVTNGITGSLFGTASWASNATSSSFAGNSLTASYLNTLNQDLAFNGNLTLNGTASISYLDVRFESASVIYSSGSNQFGDASNDTQTLFGRVSIPTGPLVITGSVSFTGSGGGGVNIDNVLRITRTGGTTGITIDGSTGKVTGGGSSVVYEPYNYADASHNFNIGHATVGNFNWSVGTNSTLSSNTQLMRLTRSGSLGIRTTAPSATLDVSGSVNISGSGVQVPFQVYSGVTPIMQVSSSGKISIGSTTNAGYALEVYDNGIYYAGASQQAQLLIATSGSVNREGAFIAASAGRTLQMGINDNSTVPVGIDMFEANNSYPSTYLNFRVNNADLIRMTGSFVGIGTTNPTSTLDVSGSTLITGSLNVSSGITGSLFGTSSWAVNASSAVSSSYPLSVTAGAIYSTVPSATSTGKNNAILLGPSAGTGVTSIYNSNFIGNGAGSGAVNAYQSNFVGVYAGSEAANADDSNFIGMFAGYKAASASFSNLMGWQAGYTPDALTSIGSNNIIIGTNISLAPQQKDSINLGGIIFATGSYSSIAGNPSTGSQYGIGRVGINKVLPQYTLDVSGSGNFSNGLTVTGSGNQVPFQVSSGSTSLLFVSGSGNVGIGTNAPDRPLHINSAGISGLRVDVTGTAENAIYLGNATSLIRWSNGAYFNNKGIYSGTNDQQYVTFDGTSTQVRLQIKASNGNVGINTTTDTGHKLLVTGSGTSGSLNVDGTLYVSGSRVGIGKSAPTATLDISGSTLITGSLNVSSGITGSLFGTASWASNAVTASYILQAVSSSFATNASTASYVLQAVSASYSTSASNADLLDGLHASSFVLNSQTSSMTVLSASFASTASYVNTLNQNVLISGSLTVGSGSSGPNENTITLGARDNGSEGGQLGLNAPGGTYTSASMIDNYTNLFRILRGTNAGSDALVAQWNMHNKQMSLPAYNTPTAFTGTTLVGLLGFDSSGNILTTTTGSGGGGGGGVTITNNTDNYIITATGTANTINGESGLQYNGSSLTVTGQITASGAITSTANNAMYFRGGDDAEFWDINVANTVGIYGQQTQTVAGLKLGSAGATLYGSGSRFGIATTSPVATLDINGNLYVASGITGSLFGTSSWANNARTASYVQNAQSASYVLQAVSASFASTASFVSSIASNITNNTDNYVLTATGGSTINGESSLTFDGTLLKVTGQLEQGDGGVDARGTESHAEGRETVAVGNQSHAEGYQTLASGSQSHAEGSQTVAKGQSSHAEGSLTLASGTYSHAEGYYTTASGNYAHAEGWNTQATGLYSHAEGISTYATQPGAHAEGNGGTAQAAYSHVEGHNTNTNGSYSHAEGSTTTATGDYSHAEGYQTTTTGNYSHAEGSQTDAKGSYSHAEGTGTKSRGNYSHTEGIQTETGTVYGFAAGNDIAISGGVVTLDNTYGDASSIFKIGNLLLLDDRDYDATYGRAYFRIVSKSFDGSRTAIYLEDTTVATSVAVVGDPAYYTSWSSYAGNMPLYGPYSHAEGYGTVVLTDNSHAEGNGAVAAGETTHAEGINTVALGTYSHAEGNTTVTLGESSHAEGVSNYTYGNGSHAEGNLTKTGIFGYNSTSIVSGVITLDASYGDVITVISSNTYIVLYDEEFDNLYGTKVFSVASSTFTGGGQTEITLDDTSVNTTRAFIGSPAFSTPTGADRVIPGLYSHTEGYNTSAAGLYSHAEGSGSMAIGIASHAEGQGTIASGNSSHAEGWRTQAIGLYAHAEGRDTVASGSYAHAEGRDTAANGSYSHAEGESTQANNTAAHAEGQGTVASGPYSHAEGNGTTASGQASHAEGQGTTASGLSAHAEGLGTKASGDYQHAQGLYNIEDTTAGAFIVGNGSSDGNRSNLIYAAGTNVQITGSLRGQVSALSIASNTASINLATNNFFTINLVNGANTHISASNIRPGQTINLRVSQSSAGTGTVSFNSAIEQASGAAYTGSMIANAEDIVTFISFDSTKLYMSAIRNLV